MSKNFRIGEKQMSLTQYQQYQLSQLKQIKNCINRKVEFMALGYTDTLNTTFQDKNIVEKDEIVELLLDTAIKYLEKKQK